MGPIFNKKVAKKCNLWDRKQYTYNCLQLTKSTIAGWKKKKRGKRGEENVDVQTKRSLKPSFFFLDSANHILFIYLFVHSREQVSESNGRLMKVLI